VTAILLALLATTAYNAGFVLEKRALATLPKIDVRRPMRLLRTLCTAPAWLAGFVCMAVGLGCQLVVLDLLPISVAQPLQAAGIGVLLLLAWLLLDERAARRDWWRLGAVAASVATLGLSVDGHTRPGTAPAGTAAMTVVLGVSAVIAVLLYLHAQQPGGRHHLPSTGAYVGLATGLLYGMAGLALKALSSQLAHRDLAGIIAILPGSPYLYLVLGTSLAGMVLFQTALQRYRASVVIPTSNVAGSCYVLVAGTSLFHETLPTAPIPLALRAIGFALALTALAIQPEPIRPTADAPTPRKDQPTWPSTRVSSTSSHAPSTRDRCCISPTTPRSTTPVCAACTMLSRISP